MRCLIIDSDWMWYIYIYIEHNFVARLIEYDVIFNHLGKLLDNLLLNY